MLNYDDLNTVIKAAKKSKGVDKKDIECIQRVERWLQSRIRKLERDKAERERIERKKSKDSFQVTWLGSK